VVAVTEAAQARSLRQDSAALGEEIAQVQREIERDLQLAGLKNDPLLPLLRTQARSLGLQWRLHDQSMNNFGSVTDRLERLLGDAVRKTEGATEKQMAAVRAQIAAVTTETIRADVVRELSGWSRRFDRSTALKAVLVLAVVGLGSGAAAYVAGRDAGRDQAVAVSTGVVAALAAEPQQSAQWLELMRSNNILTAIKHCTPIEDPTGRACQVSLWLSPVKVGAP
jgi:hypothetical protein